MCMLVGDIYLFTIVVYVVHYDEEAQSVAYERNKYTMVYFGGWGEC